MKILYISPVSVTLELENDSIYFSNNFFDVYINGKLKIKDCKTNAFSIYGLEPNKEYEVEALNEKISFKTKKVSEIKNTKFIENDGIRNVTKELQSLIDSCKNDSLLVFEKGTYLITSLKLKSNLTVYLKKDAKIIGDINKDNYEVIPPFEIINDKRIERGVFEGTPRYMLLSIINITDAKNVSLIGEGTIDGRAELGPWWIDVKNLPYVRPHLVFINNSENIVLDSLTIKNSPCWTIHPYFAKNISFFNLYIENPKDSPNTDGIDPQFVEDCKIIGVHFSVGDDCISIKSGKLDLARMHEEVSKNITIRNCWMQYGHGAIALGSEISRGLENLDCERCFFDHTDRGLRIKVRRGRGDICRIDNILFKNIKMDGVLTPITMNMFYFCDPDGKTNYVQTKEKLPIDDRTPYLGKFTFKNIEATNCEFAAGYFYGLPEQFIEEINIIDSTFSFNNNAKEGKPIMMCDAEVCSRKGFVAYYVNKLHLKNVILKGNIGEKIEAYNTKEIIDE